MSNLSNMWGERQLLKTASTPHVGILLVAPPVVAPPVEAAEADAENDDTNDQTSY